MCKDRVGARTPDYHALNYIARSSGLLDLIVNIFADGLFNFLDFLLRDQTSADNFVSKSSDGISALPNFLDLISGPAEQNSKEQL